MEGRLGGNVRDAVQELLGAGPADLDAAKQIGFGTRHLEDALRPGIAPLLRRCRDRAGSEPWCRDGWARGRPFPACPWACRARTPCGRASARSRLPPPMPSLRQCVGDQTPTPSSRRKSRTLSKSNLPPACKVHMISSSADLFLNLGCGSTGMPRPLSVTATKPSASISTSMKLACPSSASSMELSNRPRRRGDAAPSRRCLRYTCPDAGAPAPDLRAPRYRAPCNGPRPRLWAWRRASPCRRYGAARLPATENKVLVRFLGGGLGCCFGDLAMVLMGGRGGTNQG